MRTRRVYDPSEVEGVFFFPGVSQEAELQQTVGVKPYRQAIEAGQQEFRFEGSVSSYTDGNPARVLVELLGDAKEEILDTYDSGELQPQRLWERLKHHQAAPKGTRFIRVRLIAVRRNGKNNNGYYDDLRLTAVPR